MTPHGHVYIYVYVYSHGNYLSNYVYDYVYVYVYNYSILWIQVDRLNPVDTSESSNSRPKGFSMARGQGDPWSMV